MIREVTIKGDKWIVLLLAPKAYRERCGTGSWAITQYNHEKGLREICFRKPNFCKSTVVHEVMHAYLSYRTFQGMSYGQIEEVVCDTVGNNFAAIAKVSNSIYRSFLRRSKRA